jgi:hypothetical protein
MAIWSQSRMFLRPNLEKKKKITKKGLADDSSGKSTF